MKRRILFFAAILCLCAPSLLAQTHDKFANFGRYGQANVELGAPDKKAKRVVLMGNSITDGWPRISSQFFKDHPYIIGRGIGGQTSYQFLLRFREDVVNLKPKIVVINYGTNDIALNTGPYDEDKTFGNVLSMVDIARANKIKVILTSCLPAGGFSWRDTPLERSRPGVCQEEQDPLRRLFQCSRNSRWHRDESCICQR